MAVADAAICIPGCKSTRIALTPCFLELSPPLRCETLTAENNAAGAVHQDSGGRQIKLLEGFDRLHVVRLDDPNGFTVEMKFDGVVL
jgi:hypothetical protein